MAKSRNRSSETDFLGELDFLLAVDDESRIGALRSEASYFRVKPAQCETIIAQVTAAVANWKPVGANCGMTKMELDAFADAFER